MKKLVMLGVLAFSVAVLGACANTLDGAGRDISKAGNKISDTF